MHITEFDESLTRPLIVHPHQSTKPYLFSDLHPLNDGNRSGRMLKVSRFKNSWMQWTRSNYPSPTYCLIHGFSITLTPAEL